MKRPLQLYRGYRLAELVPYRIFPLFIALLVSLDLILVPYWLSLSNVHTRRYRVLIVDILIDTVIGYILPFSVGLPLILEFTRLLRTNK